MPVNAGQVCGRFSDISLRISHSGEVKPQSHRHSKIDETVEAIRLMRSCAPSCGRGDIRGIHNCDEVYDFEAKADMRREQND